jgi:hypothetical protein
MRESPKSTVPVRYIGGFFSRLENFFEYFRTKEPDMERFTLKNAKKNNHVVVLGGGPTTGKRLESVKRYVQKTGALIYSSNYDHPEMPLTYICFATPGKFKECIVKKPRGRTLLVRNKFCRTARTWSKSYGDYTMYQYGDESSKQGAYQLKHLPMTSVGHFPVYNIGNAGFTTIALACLSVPTTMLLVGFDGLCSSNQKLTYKQELLDYPENKGVIKGRYFGKVILGFVQSRNITLQAFPEDRLWGWKEKLGVEVVDY